MNLKYNIADYEGVPDIGQRAVVGDIVQLAKQELEVVACQETNVPMLNIDVDQLAPGDLLFIKKIGLTISNPSTDKPVALGVDFTEDTWGHRIKNFLEDEEDDDSGFFSSPTSSLATGLFLGGLGSGGFGSFGGGGGFGGFGGGSFRGGGASGSF